MLFTVFFITSLLATTGLGSPMVDEVALPNGVQENQLEARQVPSHTNTRGHGLIRDSSLSFYVLNGQTQQFGQSVSYESGGQVTIAVTPQGASGCQITIDRRCGGCANWTFVRRVNCPDGLETSGCFISDPLGVSCATQQCPRFQTFT
ncbi:hypothetical protein B0J12DRAFT_702358 [Macrophomina phaseolina]|uniref:Uncharacterized protein n=1 Tax=Macrophomina phaseolina TaxID=35725 RepID=A0ABQ8G2B7_9PEZI|nr:hypothetical protein B0J12DRAFT_702358 [Macrophomina phaseolina]